MLIFSAGFCSCTLADMLQPEFLLIQSLSRHRTHFSFSPTPFTPLSQSLSINRRDKPKQICLKHLSGLMVSQERYPYPLLSTDTNGILTCLQINRLLCLCVWWGGSVHSHQCLFEFDVWASFIISDHKEGLSVCPFAPTHSDMSYTSMSVQQRELLKAICFIENGLSFSLILQRLRRNLTVYDLIEIFNRL